MLRAEEDGPDRWVVILHLDEHDRPLPLIRPRHNCRLGRVITRPEDGLLVAELLFRAPLRRGQTVITEHELVNRAPYPLATNYDRKFRRPVHEYVLEVTFDPAALPRTCTRTVQDADGARQSFGVHAWTRATPSTASPSSSAPAATASPGPGDSPTRSERRARSYEQAVRSALRPMSGLGL